MVLGTSFREGELTAQREQALQDGGNFDAARGDEAPSLLDNLATVNMVLKLRDRLADCSTNDS